MLCPARTVSRVAVRREWMSGVAQRTNSLAAKGIRDGSACSFARSAGNSASAAIALEIVCRVVSLVATMNVAKFSHRASESSGLFSTVSRVRMLSMSLPPDPARSATRSPT